MRAGASNFVDVGSGDASTPVGDSDASSSTYDKSRGFPLRPGYGQSGRQISLLGNFFPVRVKCGSQTVYHYDIDINQLRSRDAAGGDEATVPDDLDPFSARYKKLRGKINIEVIQEAVRRNSGPGQLFHGVVPVFDGARNLYTTKMLNLDMHKANQESLCRLQVELDVNGRQERYAFNVKLASSIDFALLNEYYKRNLSVPPHDCLQALDIILRYGPTYSGVPINQSLYIRASEDSSRQSIGSGQELAFGYYQSVQAINSGPALVVDRTTTVFYESGPVLEVAAKVHGLKNVAELLPKHFTGAFHSRVEGALKGQDVTVSHLTYKRKYRVKSLSQKSAQQIEIDFTKPDAEGNPVFVKKMTIEEFYKVVHRKELRYPFLVCIVTGTEKRPNYLPLELCLLVADQPVKVLSSEATATMIRVSASQKPSERLRLIQEALSKSKEQSKPYLDEFQLQVRNNPVKLLGRILPVPTLSYVGGTITPRDGKWDLAHKKMTRGVSLTANEWVVIVFEPRVSKNDVETLVRNFMLQGRQMGMDIEKPTTVQRTFVKGNVEKEFQIAKSKFPNLKLVVCVVFQSNDLYREIKLVGDCKEGIATQCVHQKNTRRYSDEKYIVNVLLKINAKLGGISSVLQQTEAIPSALLEGQTLVIGIDFTHPSPSDKLPTSICAVVGSADAGQKSWFSSVRVNKGNAQVELVTALDEMVKSLLINYVKKNGFFPKRIVIYRDGISEAQFQKVLSVEMKSVKLGVAAAREANKSVAFEDPKITFIIVQKNHRARFVPENPRDGVGRGLNVPPGTVVDSDVIHVTDNDFYLAAHEGLQVQFLVVYIPCVNLRLNFREQVVRPITSFSTTTVNSPPTTCSSSLTVFLTASFAVCVALPFQHPLLMRISWPIALDSISWPHLDFTSIIPSSRRRTRTPTYSTMFKTFE